MDKNQPLVTGNPLYSYARHWLTLQLIKGAALIGLVGEQLSPAILWLAEAVVLALAWLVVKYLVPILVKVGFVDFFKKNTSLILLLLSCSALLMMPLALASCGDYAVSGFVKDEKSGAKVVISEGTKPSVLIPVNTEDGRFSGFVEVSGK